MFKSRSEGNVVYKCSIRLLDDSFLELEFQVEFFSDMLCILIRIHKLISPENSPRNVAKTFARERKIISDAEFLVFCLKFCEFN